MAKPLAFSYPEEDLYGEIKIGQKSGIFERFLMEF